MTVRCEPGRLVCRVGVGEQWREGVVEFVLGARRQHDHLLHESAPGNRSGPGGRGEELLECGTAALDVVGERFLRDRGVLVSLVELVGEGGFGGCEKHGRDEREHDGRAVPTLRIREIDDLVDGARESLFGRYGKTLVHRPILAPVRGCALPDLRRATPCTRIP